MIRDSETYTDNAIIPRTKMATRQPKAWISFSDRGENMSVPMPRPQTRMPMAMPLRWTNHLETVAAVGA